MITIHRLKPPARNNLKQGKLQLQTMETANPLCSRISRQACERKTFRRYEIHKARYEAARQLSRLSAQMAADRAGRTHSRAPVERSRASYQRSRAELQARQSDAARRKPNKLAGRQARYQRHTKHAIRKRLVSAAERTNRAITLEDLTGIRRRTSIGGRQNRARRSHWGYAPWGVFVATKARRVGVPVRLVHPAQTSSRAAECGHTERAN